LITPDSSDVAHIKKATFGGTLNRTSDLSGVGVVTIQRIEGGHGGVTQNKLESGVCRTRNYQ